MAYDDKRSARRMRVLKDGKIVTMNNRSVIDCAVRDLSETGARLRCQDQAAVPNEFRLLLPHDKTIRDAKVVWRRDDHVGIAFTGPAKLAPPRKW
ncbi:MAG: PilZ domain-containing protein [Rhizobiales bacterium]|nr:PilZ domain-containing protein [Hyphomicrobiales bacterium]MBI3672307.1 PilZ domain-containing protein [Hyphomicrobiales bacterium]